MLFECMMKKWILLLVILLNWQAFALTPCTQAGTEYKKFFELSIGQMIKIANSEKASSERLKSMEELIEPCVDIKRITTRVLGKLKWGSMSIAQRANFITEYKKFFIIEFGEIILSTLKDVAHYTIRENKGLGSYIVSLIYSDKSSKNKLEVEVTLEELNSRLQILDGKFVEVSFVKSQRDLFDRLYSENPACVLNFNAESYRQDKCRKTTK